MFSIGLFDPMFFVISTGIVAAMIALHEKQFSNNYDAIYRLKARYANTCHHNHKQHANKNICICYDKVI